MSLRILAGDGSIHVFPPETATSVINGVLDRYHAWLAQFGAPRRDALRQAQLATNSDNGDKFSSVLPATNIPMRGNANLAAANAPGADMSGLAAPIVPCLPSNVANADVALARTMPAGEGQSEQGAVNMYSPTNGAILRTLTGNAAGHPDLRNPGSDFDFSFSYDRGTERPSTIHSHPQAARTGTAAAEGWYSPAQLDRINQFPSPDRGRGRGDLAVMNQTGAALVIRAPDGSVREFCRPTGGPIHVRTLFGQPPSGVIPPGFVLDPQGGFP